MCRLAIIKHVAGIENKIVQSNKIGNFYKYANKKLSCKSGIGVIKTGDGTTISDPFELANCFNDFFASVYMVDNNVIPSIDPRFPVYLIMSRSITLPSLVQMFSKF